MRAYIRSTVILSNILSMWFLPPDARAASQDLWRLPVPSTAEGESWSLDMGIESERSVVPPFRAGSRDRWRLVTEGTWRPARNVLLDAHWDGLMDIHPDGEVIRGPGDLLLGTTLHTAVDERGREPAGAMGVGWRVKLPNASDRGELGTDETDVLVGLSAHGHYRYFEGNMSTGLAILGNPLRYAAQDDVPFLTAEIGAIPPFSLLFPRVHGGLAWAFQTSRNPARGEVFGGALWGRSWRIGVEVGGGLTPAAADVRASLRMGYARCSQSPDP